MRGENPSPWACQGKVKFESMAVAKRVARERRKSGPHRRGGKGGDAYRCLTCGGIHIGRRHEPKNEPPRE
jgi:hypothetical protein